MNRAAVKLSPRQFAPIPSKREAEIMALDRKGKRRKEIAALLGISPNTVYAHLARIRLKNAGLIPGAALKKFLKRSTAGKTR